MNTHVFSNASYFNISDGQEYTRTIKRQLLQHQRWTRVHTHLQKAVAQANSVSSEGGTSMRQMNRKDFEYHVLLVQDVTSGRHEYADLDAPGRAVEKNETDSRLQANPPQSPVRFGVLDYTPSVS